MVEMDGDGGRLARLSTRVGVHTVTEGPSLVTISV